MYGLRGALFVITCGIRLVYSVLKGWEAGGGSVGDCFLIRRSYP